MNLFQKKHFNLFNVTQSSLFLSLSLWALFINLKCPVNTEYLLMLIPLRNFSFAGGFLFVSKSHVVFFLVLFLFILMKSAIFCPSVVIFLVVSSQCFKCLRYFCFCQTDWTLQHFPMFINATSWTEIICSYKFMLSLSFSWHSIRFSWIYLLLSCARI